MGKRKRNSFDNPKIEFPISPQIFEFHDWLTDNFSFQESNSISQIFNRITYEAKKGLFEVHRPLLPENHDDWINTARIWFFLNIFNDSGRILDIGTGDGWPAIPLALRGRTVVGIDPSPKRVKTAEGQAEIWESQNVQFFNMNGEFLRFFDESFNSAIVFNSLEYFQKPQAVFYEIFRVLRNEGKVAIRCESLNKFFSWNHFFHHSFFPLDDHKWQFNFRFRFPDSFSEQTYSLVFNSLGKTILKKISLMETNSRSVETLLKILRNFRGQETEALRTKTQYYSFKTVQNWLKKAGFLKIKTFRDPEILTQSFLDVQNLHEKGHPFSHPPTFEGICSSIGSLAAKIEVDGSVEDGIIVAEKSRI